ncbi:MAG: preprotein translocase subunit SecA, partial [Synergistes sp.]|nr:preprotein translocase subunit SecA [Synergistes sp.]
IRKQLLAYDNVMNRQREAVYTERADILNDEDIIGRTLSVLEDTASAQLDRIFAGNSEEGPNVNAAAVRLNALFWPGISRPLENVQTQEDLERVRPHILEEIRSRFSQKIEELGSDLSAQIFRYIVLEVLDKNWKEHLLAMDELRRGIGLRAIGQKDPLVEYQFESFSLFQEMLERVREGITEFALRVSVVTKEQEQEERSKKWRESRDALDIPASSGAMYNDDMENPGSPPRRRRRGLS